jgi:O-acetyl-ADP-ribose deacetylase (regulator of RNase III)
MSDRKTVPTDQAPTTTATSTVRELRGDLFSAETALAHCVSACFHMNKGVARLFKHRFDGVTDLIAQKKRVGEAAVLACPPPASANDDAKKNKTVGASSGRFLYYLVTKDKFWQKPTYQALRSALLDMRKHAQVHGVTAIAMPRIGCGLDKLEWSRVLQLIRDVFSAESGIVVTVYTKES